ncbi:hypothetical protein CXU19_00330 [Akkermansia muciniphila]|nr:hypothetical protein CXU19_00330 [Akkermansia muciniphila]PNC37562.1 hypothetical protein CXU20_12275 [Akkermansia muciniphila]
MNKIRFMQKLAVFLAVAGFSDCEWSFTLLLFFLMASNIKHISFNININSGNRKSSMKDK